ncbi:MAG TPA: hypothetical protein VI258_02355 [Rhodanobacteraceae bacterium]
MNWLIPAWIIVAPTLAIALSGLIGGSKTAWSGYVASDRGPSRASSSPLT